MVRHCTYCIELNYNNDDTSVVDPDPVGYETFSRIRIESEQLPIRNEFERKLLRQTDKSFTMISTKCSI